MRGHGPAHDATAPDVEHDREVQEASPRRNVGDVGDPELIRTGGREPSASARFRRGGNVSLITISAVSIVEARVEIDIPCDVQQVDETGYVWTFLHEARDPSRIVRGAIVVAADEEDPVLARVVSLTERPGGVKVHLEILPGDPQEYAEALRRAHLLPA
jgi:hypothetical protein